MDIDVNYLAVIIGAVINIVLGFLWYGPLFGKKWIVLMNFTPEQIAAGKAKGMGKNYAIMALGALVMSYVLWHIISYTIGFMQISGAMEGAEAACWIWLGFVAPVTLGTVLWEGKPWKLWILNAGYYFVALVIMGAVLASFM